MLSEKVLFGEVSPDYVTERLHCTAEQIDLPESLFYI